MAQSGEIKYFLKFAINVPHSDVRRMLNGGSRLLYSLKDCSRAGRVHWKLKMYKNETDSEDAMVAIYLKFEPQVHAEGVGCSSEFVIRVTGPEGRSVERQSSSLRHFSKDDDCWGWSQFAKASELRQLVSTIDNVEYLKLSGVIKIFDSSRLLYPHRRHNFARAQNGADFKIRVALATFHVHRAVLALNSDYFASLFAHDCLETKSGQVVLQDEKIQDVHLLLQFMYPGYSDVLEESTLLPLSRLSAKYFVHTLAWQCMQFIDSRLPETKEADRTMKYYTICLKLLQCGDLAEQCVKVASGIPWYKVKDTAHFKELEENEKAAFLQGYLDFKEEKRARTPMPPRAIRQAQTMENEEEKQAKDREAEETQEEADGEEKDTPEA